VPHYLMGIAGAGILGMFMLVSGFFQPADQLPAPVWRYPMHYIAYHSYAFGGFMHNQFDGTDGWGCPSVGAFMDGEYDLDCTLTGEEIVSELLDPRRCWHAQQVGRGGSPVGHDDHLPRPLLPGDQNERTHARRVMIMRESAHEREEREVSPGFPSPGFLALMVL
jgi:hypothetical protein